MEGWWRRVRRGGPSPPSRRLTEADFSDGCEESSDTD